MIFYKYNNQFGGLITDVEDVAMHESQARFSFVSVVKLLSRNELNIHSVIWKIDNHTKHSLAKSIDINGFYEYNPHHGWNKLSHDILTLFQKQN